MIIIKMILGLVIGILFGTFIFIAAPIVFFVGAAMDSKWPWEM